MSNFLDRIAGRRPPTSAQKAKDRLKLVLIHDRTDVAPGVIDAMRDEIIAVISKHIDIDREAVRIHLTQDDRLSRLVADIPLVPARRRRG